MSMHIDAKKGEIAKTVVVGGDPARIRHIAETYLEDAKLVNEKRSKPFTCNIDRSDDRLTSPH